MENIYVVGAFKQYRSCILTVYNLFNRYEHYHGCFAISKVDEQMNHLFEKIASTYTHMVQQIANLETSGNENALFSFVNYTDKALFLQYILAVMAKHEDKICSVLQKTEQSQVSFHLNDLEYNVKGAAQLVNRMEMMLMSGQKIYTSTLRVVA
jgi:hypothetical protein